MAKKIRLSTLAKVKSQDLQRSASGAALASVRDPTREAFAAPNAPAGFHAHTGPVERRITSFVNRRRNK